MARSRIGIRPADNGRYPDEKVINFYSPNGGGLISFTMKDDGTLLVEVYRTDPTVIVSTARDAAVADALAEVDRQRKPLSGSASLYMVALEALATAVRAGQAVTS
jgi:hypothetical protein